MKKSKFNKYNDGKRTRDNFQERNKTHSLLLPPPAMLESYEELSPGITEKLIDIVKKEQGHRQKWEDSYLKIMARNIFFGQLIAFIFSCLVLYFTIDLAKGNNTTVASTIFICWAVLFIIINISFRRKKPRRHVKR